MPTLEQAPPIPSGPAWAQPRAWLERGLQREAQGDPKSAAYCYYLAGEFGRCQPALDRLAALGYLSLR